MDDTYAEVEQALGRRLLQRDRDSVPNLNDVSDALLADARTVLANSRSMLTIYEFLRYYCGGENFRHFGNFIEDVVRGNQPAAEWGLGDRAWAPDTSLQDQLYKSRDALLEPMGGYHGLRFPAYLQAWTNGASHSGAPVRPLYGVNYRNWTEYCKPGVSLFSTSTLEPAPDIHSTVCRWIAARIARCTAAGHLPGVEGLRARWGEIEIADLADWSPDARTALAVLLRELRELGPSAEHIPGFRAPDEWYHQAAQSDNA